MKGGEEGNPEAIMSTIYQALVLVKYRRCLDDIRVDTSKAVEKRHIFADNDQI